jgi:hypothetical protein
MATIESPTPLMKELADFLASGPSPKQLLKFRPSKAVQRRARELLARLKDDRITDEEKFELDQFVQAELLMRLVKARIRLGQTADD